MTEPYLEITYRHGRPLAAYLHLASEPGVRSARSTRADHGLVLDYDANGALIGVEITSPANAKASHLNAVLEAHQLPRLADEELMPLQAA